MRCHECGAPAAYAPAHGQVRVGLCADHIKAFMATLEDADSLQKLDPTTSVA